jgi:hypothetical protein
MRKECEKGNASTLALLRRHQEEDRQWTQEQALKEATGKRPAAAASDCIRNRAAKRQTRSGPGTAAKASKGKGSRASRGHGEGECERSDPAALGVRPGLCPHQRQRADARSAGGRACARTTMQARVHLVGRPKRRGG